MSQTSQKQDVKSVTQHGAVITMVPAAGQDTLLKVHNGLLYGKYTSPVRLNGSLIQVDEFCRLDGVSVRMDSEEEVQVWV